MVNPEFIKKSHVKNLVTILVLGLFLFNAIGLTIVRNQARDYATKQATIASEKLQDAKRLADRKIVIQTAYQTNYTTCGLRALIDPLIKTEKSAIKDPTVSASARKRQQIQLTNNLKVRRLFGTVPPDFNCKDLPKNPPK